MPIRNLTMSSTLCIFYAIYFSKIIMIIIITRCFIALLPIPSYHVESFKPSDDVFVSSIATRKALKVIELKRHIRSSVKNPLIKDIYVPGFYKSNAELCTKRGFQLRLVVLVASAPSNFTARKAIRMTWGHCRLRTDVTLGFILGEIPNQLREMVDTEDKLYGDIIIGRFVDTYYNMTLKTVSMLEWMVHYCPNARFLLKTDDDMFFNMPKLLKFLAIQENLRTKKTIFGNIKSKTLPCRVPHTKFYIPQSEFPGAMWPDFTIGAGYVVTCDLFGPLLNTALVEPYIRFEDVFLTGVVANKIGVNRVSVPVPYYVDSNVCPCYCIVRYVYAVHGLKYAEYFSYWETLFNGKPCKCIQDITEKDNKDATTRIQKIFE